MMMLMLLMTMMLLRHHHHQTAAAVAASAVSTPSLHSVHSVTLLLQAELSTHLILFLQQLHRLQQQHHAADR